MKIQKQKKTNSFEQVSFNHDGILKETYLADTKTSLSGSQSDLQYWKWHQYTGTGRSAYNHKMCI